MKKGKIMIYFLFLNHPKGEELYKVSIEKEDMARRYFSGADTIETQVEIRGKSYKAVVDYAVFSSMVNFDCFNCRDTCCGDAPSIFEEKTRKFVLENLHEYNRLTKTINILEESGYEREEIEESIREDELMIPEECIEEEVELCTCAFRPDNGTTLCSIHSMCLDKGMGPEKILEIKPVICSLWPIEILAEDDLSVLYITLPDDFTNGFTIEDYYNKSCINMDFGTSSAFKRTNPVGFEEKDYKPLIISYGDTIRYAMGDICYEEIKARLIEEELVSQEDFQEEEQQIIKKY